MTAVAAVLAVLAVVASTAATVGWRRAGAERTRAQRAAELADEAGHRAADARAGEARASEQLAAAAARAVAAEERASAAEAALAGRSAAGSAVLESVWALARLDAERARRRAAAVSTAAASLPAPGTLAAALEEEVARLREDTGTPGTLRVALDVEPSAGDAVLAVRALQSLLGVLARHCQGYDLYLHRFEGRLLAVLVCEDFDGPDAAAEEAADLLGALAPVDGHLDVDRDERGRLRARLSLPLS